VDEDATEDDPSLPSAVPLLSADVTAATTADSEAPAAEASASGADASVATGGAGTRMLTRGVAASSSSTASTCPVSSDAPPTAARRVLRWSVASRAVSGPLACSARSKPRVSASTDTGGAAAAAAAVATAEGGEAAWRECKEDRGRGSAEDDDDEEAEADEDAPRDGGAAEEAARAAAARAAAMARAMSRLRFLDLGRKGTTNPSGIAWCRAASCLDCCGLGLGWCGRSDV